MSLFDFEELFDLKWCIIGCNILACHCATAALAVKNFPFCFCQKWGRALFAAENEEAIVATARDAHAVVKVGDVVGGLCGGRILIWHHDLTDTGRRLAEQFIDRKNDPSEVYVHTISVVIHRPCRVDRAGCPRTHVSDHSGRRSSYAQHVHHVALVLEAAAGQVNWLVCSA
eukprot:CAMPEP_0117582350 /NCGR_PEP_ID=MMETSP0784-20121206/66383_1 /TAXON_ID=39447 /ORGANISM="" /LENGTH=170 /DNA_ID=CAMNT_0005382861 /DNA_START=13 /DNA_END=525 /DNA_ORIENTATION=+